MEVKEFKEELNKLGVEDPETQTAKLINVIYDTKDPVLQEMISTSNINEFISAYLKNTLVELKSSSKDIDAILKDSNKRVEKVKSESKTYVSKKIEIENKNQASVKENKELKTVTEEISKSIDMYLNADASERAKKNEDAYARVWGYDKDDVKGIKEFSKMMDEYYDLLKKDNLTLEEKKKMEELKAGMRHKIHSKSTTKGTKQYFDFLKKMGVDLESFENPKTSQEQLLNEIGKIKAIDTTIFIISSCEESGITSHEQLAKEVMRQIDKRIRTGKYNELKCIDQKMLDEILNVSKEIKEEVRVKKGQDGQGVEDYKAISMQEKAYTHVASDEEYKNIIMQEAIYKAQMEKVEMEVEETLPDLSSDDMWAMFEASMEHALEMQELAEGEPLTNSEGDKAIEENGEELDDSGIDALEKDIKLNGKLDNKDKIFIDMTPPISQFEVANGKKIDVEEIDGSGIDALGKEKVEKEGTSKKEPNNNDKMHIDKTPPISQFEVGAKKKIAEEELISDDLPQNEQEIEIPELTNKEKSQNQTQLAVYKPRITDRIKGFINDIKNMGVMESFNKNFMSNDVQVPINESREEQLKGINSNEEQVNLAQEENIKKQNLLTKVKDSLKKAFGIKDEKAEKIAQEQSDKLDSSKDSKESKGGFDFNSPDEELMAKTAAVGKDAAAKLKNKDANVVSTAEPTVSTDERED